MEIILIAPISQWIINDILNSLILRSISTLIFLNSCIFSFLNNGYFLNFICTTFSCSFPIYSTYFSLEQVLLFLLYWLSENSEHAVFKKWGIVRAVDWPHKQDLWQQIYPENISPKIREFFFWNSNFPSDLDAEFFQFVLYALVKKNVRFFCWMLWQVFVIFVSVFELACVVGFSESESHLCWYWS